MSEVDETVSGFYHDWIQPGNNPQTDSGIYVKAYCPCSSFERFYNHVVGHTREEIEGKRYSLSVRSTDG